MIGEAAFDGVFIPYLLILTIVAFLVLLPVRWILRRVQFYRLVWHAGLFDTALFVAILWAIVLASTRIGSGAVRP
jgi:protein AaeX